MKAKLNVALLILVGLGGCAVDGGYQTYDSYGYPEPYYYYGPGYGAVYGGGYWYDGRDRRYYYDQNRNGIPDRNEAHRPQDGNRPGGGNSSPPNTNAGNRVREAVVNRNEQQKQIERGPTPSRNDSDGDGNPMLDNWRNGFPGRSGRK
jgi:hypothetical protein